MTTRRAFIGALAAGLAAPLTAEAQPAEKTYRIGNLSSLEGPSINHVAFRTNRTEELRRELSAVFKHVELLGTFGSDKLYEIEFQRNQESLQRARQRLRRRLPTSYQVRFAVIKGVKAALLGCTAGAIMGARPLRGGRS